MTEVYIVDCTTFMDEQAITDALPRLDAYRRKKVQSLHALNKKAQSVATGLLLQEIFGSDALYDRTANGKPYLVGNKAYFSVAHSHQWVAIAVSDREIGFDIEVISPIRPAILRRCFTSEEQTWIDEDAERFTQLWVRKEAYGKYTGRGLTTPLSALIPNESIPHSENHWQNTRYALWGDDCCNLSFKNLHI